MKKILLLDDDKQYLEEILQEIKLSGCVFEYFKSSQEAYKYIETNKNEIGLTLISLNNALGYPAVRKIKRSLHPNSTLCVYSNSESTALREWVYKQEIKHFYTAPFQKADLVNFCKKLILNKTIHFNYQQLLDLSTTLSKYTDTADSLVQQHAASSTSIQELQHKLARSLTNYEHQKSFLTEVQ